MQTKINFTELESLEDLGAVIEGDVFKTDMGDVAYFAEENGMREFIMPSVSGRINSYSLQIGKEGRVMSNGGLMFNPLDLVFKTYSPEKEGYWKRKSMLNKLNLRSKL